MQSSSLEERLFDLISTLPGTVLYSNGETMILAYVGSKQRRQAKCAIENTLIFDTVSFPRFFNQWTDGGETSRYL
jgi:hypothetical protein